MAAATPQVRTALLVLCCSTICSRLHRNQSERCAPAPQPPPPLHCPSLTAAIGCGQWLLSEGSNRWTCYVNVRFYRNRVPAGMHRSDFQPRELAGTAGAALPPLLCPGWLLSLLRWALTHSALQEPALCYQGVALTMDASFPGRQIPSGSCRGSCRSLAVHCTAEQCTAAGRSSCVLLLISLG